MDAIDPDDLVDVPCDVFIPAALGGMIHEGNAARLVPDGRGRREQPHHPGRRRDPALENGVYVVPDVMANAGGVVVSYFEWVQNLQHFRWDEREVNDRLGASCGRPSARSPGGPARHGLTLREAAYELGIERVVEAATTRGYIS